MKTLLIVTAAAALWGGAHALDGDMAPNAAARSADTSARTPAARSYRLVADGGAASCTLTRGARVGAGLSRLAVGRDCPSLLPALARARFWREARDGTVIFSDEGANPIVSFAAAGGAGYESYRPALPLLALTAVR